MEYTTVTDALNAVPPDTTQAYNLASKNMNDDNTMTQKIDAVVAAQGAVSAAVKAAVDYADGQ